MIGTHTKRVAKKGASILSIDVFFKIWGNILKKYLLFSLERTTEWEYTSVFWRSQIYLSKSSLVATLQHATQGYKKLLRISEFNRSVCCRKIQFLLDKSHLSFSLLVIYFSLNMITYYNRFKQHLL